MRRYRRTFWLALITLTLHHTACAEWVPPLERAKAREQTDTLAADNVRIPSKWFRGAKGYEDAQELQKATQADIFIYFVRPNTPDEKGLCKWFEDRGVKSQPVNRLLRDYLKVMVPLPANPRNQDLAETFRVKKTPAVFVVRASDGWRNRITVFKWDENPIKLLEPDELEEAIRLNSSEKYHPPKDDTEAE